MRQRLYSIQTTSVLWWLTNSMIYTLVMCTIWMVIKIATSEQQLYFGICMHSGPRAKSMHLRPSQLCLLMSINDIPDSDGHVRTYIDPSFRASC